MSHLTAAQRGNIETLLQEKYTNKEIGIKLGKHRSTIGREIAKGLDGSGDYHAWIAQVAYETNRKRSKQIPILITQLTIGYVVPSLVALRKVGIQLRQLVH